MAVYEQSGRDGVVYWVCDFQWKDPNTGVKRRIRRACKDPKGRLVKSRTAAEKAELDIRGQLAAGTFEVAVAEPQPAPGVPTLASFKERYFRDHVAKLKPSSRSAQETIWRVSLLPELGDTPLDQIDADAIAKLTSTLRARGISAKTVNNALSALRTALACAEDWKLVSHVPRVKWLKVAAQKFDYFTFDETAKLLEHAPPMVVVAVRTGLRLGELIAIKWSDVDLERKTLTVERSVWWEKGGKPHEGPPKNHKSRHIPLTSDALAAIEKIGHREGRVFVNPAGTTFTKGETKWPLWRAQEAASLRRTGWHVLRHTFASHLVMKGVSIAAVQQLMGHSTIAMTMRYAHLAPDHLRGAIAALEA